MTDQPDADFVRSLGLPFMANLLRRLSDRMVSDCGAFEANLGIKAPPRTASTMNLLLTCGPQNVTGIAARLRQSHPLVITWVKQLEELGLVQSEEDPSDRRRTVVSLTPNGQAEAERMAVMSSQIGRAYAQVMSEADADIFDALWRLYDRLGNGRLVEALQHIAEQDAKAGKGK